LVLESLTPNTILEHRMSAVEGTGAAREPTDLLLSFGTGEASARDELLPLVYDELRRIAARFLRRERPGHTLQPTALVHEAYLRLIDQHRVDWRNRAQFVGLAAVMMRRVLVNHARDRAAAKRGGGERVALTVAAVAFDGRPELDVLAIHQALERLNVIDARKSQVVELKFFGGLTTGEIAEVLQISPATIERDWTFARAWLYDAIGDEARPGS
jgi:RNA polymerase sigma factor (TIGR02999 family)